jgi:hypothetical protein
MFVLHFCTMPLIGSSLGFGFRPRSRQVGYCVSLWPRRSSVRVNMTGRVRPLIKSTWPLHAVRHAQPLISLHACCTSVCTSGMASGLQHFKPILTIEGDNSMPQLATRTCIQRLRSTPRVQVIRRGLNHPSKSKLLTRFLPLLLLSQVFPARGCALTEPSPSNHGQVASQSYRLTIFLNS